MDPDQERQERIQASLKEREREVKMSRTAQEKEWDRERDQLRKSEATQHFKALLVDMVSHFDCDATVVSLLTIFQNCKELSQDCMNH